MVETNDSPDLVRVLRVTVTTNIAKRLMLVGACRYRCYERSLEMDDGSLMFRNIIGCDIGQKEFRRVQYGTVRYGTVL